jgi:hypothetical protein
MGRGANQIQAITALLAIARQRRVAIPAEAAGSTQAKTVFKVSQYISHQVSSLSEQVFYEHQLRCWPEYQYAGSRILSRWTV